MAALDQPDPGRPWYRRWTVVGVAILGVIQSLETAGAIPAGVMETIASYGDILGGVLVALGVYRRLPA